MERGQLSEMQRDVAWVGKSQSEREATTAFNLNLGGEENARKAGIRVSAVGAARGDGPNSEKEREKRRREDMQDALRRMAELDARLADLYDERDQILADIRETQERMDTLRAGIDAIEANGDVERDADGNIQDPALEARLREYERRTRRPVDRNDPEALLTALRDQFRYETGEMGRHRERERDNQSEIDRAQREREELGRTLDRDQFSADADSEASRAQALSNTAAVRDVEVDLTDLDAEQEEEFDALFEGIDEVAFESDGYEAYADEIDPEGAAARPAPEPSEPDSNAQPEANQPDRQDEPSAGAPVIPGMNG